RCSDIAECSWQQGKSFAVFRKVVADVIRFNRSIVLRPHDLANSELINPAHVKVQAVPASLSGVCLTIIHILGIELLRPVGHQCFVGLTVSCHLAPSLPRCSSKVSCTSGSGTA